MPVFLNNTVRSVKWFKDANEKGELDMKPPFQRNLVWTDKQKSYLIDTILCGYPIPEIYMQDIYNDKGDAKYIVVDGQQRIRACLDFIGNKFSIDPAKTPLFGDMSFDDLLPELKKRIYEYSFIVRLMPEIPDSELRLIFQRLNQNNVILNSQELRHATYWGDFIQTMNNLADMENWQKIQVFSTNDIKRMLDVEFISELTIAYLNGLQNKKLSLDRFYRIYEENDFDKKNDVVDIFEKVLGEILQVLPNIGATRWSKKSDFYTLFLIFAKNKIRLPLSSEKRDLATNILLKFAKDLEGYVTTIKDSEEEGSGNLFTNLMNNQVNITDNIMLYAVGLRASTDLSSRKRREEALENVLLGIWQ